MSKLLVALALCAAPVARGFGHFKDVCEHELVAGGYGSVEEVTFTELADCTPGINFQANNFKPPTEPAFHGPSQCRVVSFLSFGCVPDIRRVGDERRLLFRFRETGRNTAGRSPRVHASRHGPSSSQTSAASTARTSRA